MYKRAISLLTAMVFFVQMFCALTSFAADSGGTNVTFSSATGYTVANNVAGTQDYEIVKGQYGKSSGDSSMRLYTVGGTYSSSGKQYVRIAPDISAASSGEYIHVSFEYLRENLFCGLTVEMGMYDSQGTKLYTKKLIDCLSAPTTIGTVRVLSNATNSSTSGTHYDYKELVGSWKRIDMYFSPDTNKAKVFIDGAYAVEKNLNTGWGGSSFVPGIKNVFRLDFIHVLDKKTSHEPSAVQIDNVVVEKVSSIPGSIEYKKLGEKINFDDDNMSIISGTSSIMSYGVSFYNTSTSQDAVLQTYSNNLTVRPSVKFGSSAANLVKNEIYGKPSWDNSLYTSIPSDASSGENAMYYHPGAADLAVGDVGHLTFSVANEKSDVSLKLHTDDAVFSDGTADSDLFEMSVQNGKFKFLNNEINLSWEAQRWYKVDILFKVSSEGTKADCYIDGIKYSSGLELSASALKDIGILNFTDEPNAAYYIDDIAYGRFGPSEYFDPSSGRFILTDNTDLDEAIDTEKHTITVSGNYRIEDFLAKLSNRENVSVYNSNGTKIKTGLLANCIIKVSNTYGAGTYYSVETTAVMTDASIFDIADGSVVVVKDINTLNASAVGEAEAVIKLDIYADGKLCKTVNSDAASINLDELMLGKHTFDAYAYVNEQDCYIDSVDLILIEEKENIVLAKNTFNDYTSGSASISGGRIVQTAGSAVAREVVDKNGKSYGTSLVLESTKEKYTAASSKDCYIDIYTPEVNSIKKAVLEFDVCFLDNVAASTTYRGKDDLSSANNKGASLSMGKIGTATTFADTTVATLETNKWYHYKSVTDVKNKVFSLWIDDTPIVENQSFSSSLVLISSEFRIEFRPSADIFDTQSSITYAAFDNFELKEYDELAYIDSVEDASGNTDVNYTSDTLTVNMTDTIDKVTADSIKLYSTNGERPVKSVTIDENDASILYVTPKYKLSSSDVYNLVIDSGLKSAGGVSTKKNCGFFKTSAKSIDVLQGDFEVDNGAISFKTKISNKTSSDKDLTIISYIYEGNEFKGIASKSVTVKAGKNLTDSVELPYYSPAAKVYGLVTDDWTTLRPITNKLYSNSY